MARMDRKVATISFPTAELDRLDELAFRLRITRSSALRLGAALVAELPDDEIRQRADEFMDGRVARHRNGSARVR